MIIVRYGEEDDPSEAADQGRGGDKQTSDLHVVREVGHGDRADSR
jgi:hypothetical protein